MARITNRITISLPVDSGQPVEFIVRRPTAAEHQAFLKSRLTERRNKIRTDVIGPRLALMEKILVDCRHVEIDDENGNVIELNAKTEITDGIRETYGLDGRATWRDLIPTNWLSSAATYFEETTLGDDEDDAEKN